ncbi:MAG: hypothetical protein J4A00_07975 [Gammaproteobacteria bacterium]|nr:hypothetical protein [Gammaproteobacteria bacterium]
MVPELGFETTPGVTERAFQQLFLPEERLLTVKRRRLPADLVVNVLHRLHHHDEQDRLRRAIGQYYQALRNWEPGREVLAVAHLWMGIEALTTVVLRRVSQEQATDRRGLASAWNVELTMLEAEVRRRLIFRGDESAYATARKTSDGFEHGFLGFNELHQQAASVRNRVASLLRASIIHELQLTEESQTVLTDLGFDQTGHLRVIKMVRGHINGPEGELAAKNEAYPRLDWRTRYVDMPSTDDAVKYSVKEDFTGVFASGVNFRFGKIEMWGGQESTLQPHPPED